MNKYFWLEFSFKNITIHCTHITNRFRDVMIRKYCNFITSIETKLIERGNTCKYNMLCIIKSSFSVVAASDAAFTVVQSISFWLSFLFLLSFHIILNVIFNFKDSTVIKENEKGEKLGLKVVYLTHNFIHIFKEYLQYWIISDTRSIS